MSVRHFGGSIPHHLVLGIRLGHMVVKIGGVWVGELVNLGLFSFGVPCCSQYVTLRCRISTDDTKLFQIRN